MLFRLLALAYLLQPILGVTVLVGIFFVGQRRWVRVLTAVTLADAFMLRVFQDGVGRALGFLFAIVALVLVANFVSMLTWRTPRHIHYATSDSLAWPSHAANDVERWSRELIGLGFVPVPDVWYAWRFGGASRSSMVRLFRHSSDPIWVSLHAVVSPRSHSRAVYTRLTDGRWFQTATRASDATVLPDASIVTQRVGSEVSCAKLIEAHRDGLGRLEIAPISIGDVLEDHRAAREAWLSGLLARGHARLDGDTVAITPRGLLGALPRQFAGWFA